MFDTVYSALIEQLFARFLSINWIEQQVASPIILFSKTTYEVFLFQAMQDSVGMTFGSTSASYTPPKMVTSSSATKITTQYLTDSVVGKPRTRTYSVSTNIEFLQTITNFFETELKSIEARTGINIFNSLDYIKLLEERVSACYGNTSSDIFMLFGADGTLFQNCIVLDGNFKAGFSNGVCNQAEGMLSIQEIVPFDIESILTTEGKSSV